MVAAKAGRPLREVLMLDDDLRDRIGSGASILKFRCTVRQPGAASATMPPSASM